MKLISACVLLLIVCFKVKADLSEESAKALGRYSDECRKTVTISDDLVERGLVKLEYPNHPDFKKFMLCMTQKTGMIDKDGHIVADATLRKLKKTNSGVKLKKIIDKCFHEADSPEETAYSFAKCIDNEDPDFDPAA